MGDPLGASFKGSFQGWEQGLELSVIIPSPNTPSILLVPLDHCTSAIGVSNPRASPNPAFPCKAISSQSRISAQTANLQRAVLPVSDGDRRTAIGTEDHSSQLVWRTEKAAEPGGAVPGYPNLACPGVVSKAGLPKRITHRCGRCSSPTGYQG